jgi:uncharacterized membrane protein (DUF4010 family)
MVLSDKILLRKLSIIDTIIDQLRNISQIEHSRHRSVTNFLVNLVCVLIAYPHQPNKPSFGWEAFLCLSAYLEFTLIMVLSVISGSRV